MNRSYLQNIPFYFSNALQAVFQNWFRSVLTALGIVFGVGAVIAMLAVGAGAKKEILNQLELVGVNNILVKPVIKTTNQEEGSSSSAESGSSSNGDNGKEEDRQQQGKVKFTGGLTLLDAKGIRKNIPGIQRISPEVIFQTHAIRKGKRYPAKLVGIEPDFFEVYNFDLAKGKVFNQQQLRNGKPVCIIGHKISSRLFSNQDPIGKQVKMGDIWLKVIGVMQRKAISGSDEESLGIRNYNLDVYTPIKTALIRYKDRSQITQNRLQGSDQDDEEQETGTPNYNQLDKLVVQVEQSELLKPVSDVIFRMLKRRHRDVEDFQVKVPELLLKQKQQTKNLFNIVLGAIAGISLLVGGIGIMNIMLASVMERIREIGVRQALGAKPADIIGQFLAEAIIISLSGGLLGILFGVVTAKLITQFTGILTIITLPSIFLSFGVAAIVGLIFGIYPAKRASEQDPIESLRHE